MPEQGYGFSESDVRRLRDALRLSETGLQNPTVLRAVGPRRLGQSYPPGQVVRVADVADVSRYPGFIQDYDPDADEFSDADPCWLRTAGNALQTDGFGYYVSMPTLQTHDDLPVYVTNCC